MKSKKSISIQKPGRVISSALVLFIISFSGYLISAQQVSAAACVSPPATASANLDISTFSS